MSRLTKYELVNLPDGGVSKFLPGVGLIPLNEECLTDGLIERFLDAGIRTYFVERPVSLTKEQNGQTNQISSESSPENGSGSSRITGNDGNSSGDSDDTSSHGNDSGDSGSTGNSGTTKPGRIGKGSRTRNHKSGLKTDAGTGNG